MRSRLLPLALGLVLGGATAGCSDTATSPRGHSAADRGAAAAVVQHHAQTVALLTLPQTLRMEPRLVDWGDRLRSERLAEIEEMSDQLRSWGERVPDTGLAHEDEGHAVTIDASVPGVLDQAAVERLRRTRGAAFTRLWLDALLTHERGALEIATTEAESGTDPDAVALAREDVRRHAATVRALTRIQRESAS